LRKASYLNYFSAKTATTAAPNSSQVEGSDESVGSGMIPANAAGEIDIMASAVSVMSFSWVIPQVY